MFFVSVASFRTKLNSFCLLLLIVNIFFQINVFRFIKEAWKLHVHGGKPFEKLHASYPKTILHIKSLISCKKKMVSLFGKT